MRVDDSEVKCVRIINGINKVQRFQGLSQTFDGVMTGALRASGDADVWPAERSLGDDEARP